MIKSIFMVEDETLFLLKMQDLLEMLDFDVDLIETNTSEEAIAEIGVQDPGVPDCYFLDLNLKGSRLNGLELGEKIRKDHPDVVILMVSTSDDPEEIQTAQDKGFNGWIVKSGDLGARLEKFREDYLSMKDKSLGFKLYK